MKPMPFAPFMPDFFSQLTGFAPQNQMTNFMQERDPALMSRHMGREAMPAQPNGMPGLQQFAPMGGYMGLMGMFNSPFYGQQPYQPPQPPQNTPYRGDMASAMPFHGGYGAI